jgi:hypothetical protein
MDFSNPLSTLLSYVTGSSDAEAAPATPSSYSPTATQAPAQFVPMPGVNVHIMRFDKNKNPIADLPLPNEKTVDVYPTQNYLVPTKENGGKPQAPLKLPVDYVNSMAKAKAKSESIGLLDKESTEQLLPLAIREARFDDYGNNGVFVDYKTPPPKYLQPIIEKSNDIALRQKELEMKSKLAEKAGNKELSAQYDEMIYKLDGQLKKEDEKLLSDPNWTSRANSYKDINDKIAQLGLKQSTNQEIIRDKVTGRLISKADVYRSGAKDSYDIRALHVPLALYVKSKEQPGLKGLNLSRAYIGDGKDADVRIAQQAEIYQNLLHPKNKDLYNAYNNLSNQHYLTFTKGRK